MLQHVKRKTQIIRTKPVVFEDRHQAEVMSKGFPIFAKIEQRDSAFLVSPQGISHLHQRLFLGMMAQLSPFLEESTIFAKPFVSFVPGHIFERFVAMDQGKAVAVP